MMNKEDLAAIESRNQMQPHSDVTSLLAEVRELRDRQKTVIGWIGRDVTPNLREVWRYLLHQKPCPKECLVLDTAVAALDGHLGYLGLPS